MGLAPEPKGAGGRLPTLHAHMREWRAQILHRAATQLKCRGLKEAGERASLQRPYADTGSYRTWKCRSERRIELIKYWARKWARFDGAAVESQAGRKK